MTAPNTLCPPRLVARVTLPHGFLGHPAHDMLCRCWDAQFIEYNGLGLECHFYYVFDFLTPQDVAVLSHVSMAGAGVLVMSYQSYRDTYAYREGA